MRPRRPVPKPVDHYEELALFTFPFRSTNVGILLLFTLLFSIGATGFWLHTVAGVRTIIILYPATVLYTQYLFLIVEYTSLGYQRIPKISGDLVYPTADHRLLKEALLISVIISGYHNLVDPTWQFVYLCVATIAFPLATAVISNEREFVKALNPLLWVRMILAIGISRQLAIYFALQLATMWCFYEFTLGFEGFELSELISRVAILLLLVMCMFRALGIMVHAGADALGMRVVFSERLLEEARERYDQDQIDTLMARLHDLTQADKYQEAWDLLKTHAAQEYYGEDALIYARLQELQSHQLACRFGLDYIDKLLQEGNAHEAWRVFEWGSAHLRGDYKPHSGTTLLRLGEAATTRAQGELAAPLLARFREFYPGHPKQGEARLLAATLYARLLEEFTRASELVDDVAQRFPELEQTEEFTSLARLLSDDCSA